MVASATTNPVNKEPTKAQNSAVTKSKTISPDKNNPNKKPEQAQADRNKGVSLAGKVTEGLKDAATNTANKVTKVTTDVARESLKGGLTQAVANFVGPIRFMIMSNPIGMMAARPLVKFLTPKLEEYLAANKIELPIKPSSILNQLLFGDLEDLDGEVSKALDGFIDKALPEDVKKAIQSGNIAEIAKLTGSSLSSGAKGFLYKVFHHGEKSNYFTSPFKFMGEKTPLINRLSPKFQPWAAGAIVVTFGGFILRTAVKFAKIVFAGGLLAAGGAFAKKIFDRMSKGAAPGSGPEVAKGFGSGALSAMAKMGGASQEHAEAGQAKGGIGGALKAATDLAGLFSKK